MKQTHILLAVAFGVLSAGCIRDTPACRYPSPSPDAGGVRLNISTAMPAARDLGKTRIGAADFDNLDDLNIVVANSDSDAAATSEVIFVSLDGLSDGDPIAHGGHVSYHAGVDGHGIHFSRDWFEAMGLDAAGVRFFVVANCGRDLSTEVATVGELRGLKESGRGVMWGESVDISDPAHNSMPGHEGGRSLHVDLRRTVAMITVKINGQGLKPRLTITPTSVSLHNVPAWCYTGKPNIITGPDGITPIDGGSVVADGDRFDARSDPRWSTIASPASGLGYTLPSVVGAHYTDEPDGSQETIDYADADVRPLFMFENLHGPDFGAAGAPQQLKRPAAAAGTSPAQIEAVAAACSYLQVTAEYHDTEGPVQRHGTVVWRVFLGGNITDNFDVERNTYYRFTLDLMGGAIGEEEYSWRVDTNLGQMEVTESDYLLNGTGTLIADLDVTTSSNQFRCNIVRSSPAWNSNDPWVWIPDNNNWVGLDGYNGVAKPPQSPSMPGAYRLWLYVLPMIRGEGWNAVDANGEPVTKRSVTFRCYRNNNQANGTPEITVTQYEPLVRQVGPRTIYFDRVDRAPAPWGFNGVDVPVQTNGFDNVYQLLEGWLQAAALGYLPMGRPESAMMDAALTHFYQRSVANLDFNVFNMTFIMPGMPPRPVAPQFSFAIPSRAEWQWLLDLNDAEELFDPLFPLSPWIGYWTSDQTADYSRAYVWSRGTGVDDEARTTKMPYRMIWERR